MVPLFVVYGVGALALVFGLGAFFGAPYVPTRRGDLRRMFRHMRPVSPADTVLDIGSGDGIVLREALRQGAGSAIGFEINPVFFALSQFLLRADKRASVRLVNAWVTDFPDDTTLVYIFSVGRDGKRLVRKMQNETTRLQRPLTLICYGNALPGGLRPVKTFEAYFMYVFEPLHLTEA